MKIEQPRFPTPEDERRASLLYQAMRKLAEIDNEVRATNAPGVRKPAETGSQE